MVVGKSAFEIDSEERYVICRLPDRPNSNLIIPINFLPKTGKRKSNRFLLSPKLRRFYFLQLSAEQREVVRSIVPGASILETFTKISGAEALPSL